MVFYPIQTLADVGIRDIIVVTGGQNSGDFLRLLSNGKDFNLNRIHYTYQEGEGGIADALRLAELFVEGDASVFEKIGRAKPSWRNELEITDVNNMYLQENTLSHSFLDGWWTDAGTFESLVRATNLVVKTGANKIPGRGAPPRHVRAAE